MELRLVHIVDESIHKILILDKTKTKEEGKLLTWTEGATKAEARARAQETLDTIAQNGRFILN